MDPKRFQRSERLFTAALSNPPYLRESFLRHACADDELLLAELLSLLQSHEQAVPLPDLGAVRDTLNAVAPRKQEDAEATLQTTIGQYRILEVLGEGGMGVVYLARQLRPVRRNVALKVMKLGQDTPETRLRFESEQQALALMDHPAIVRIYEAGTTNDGRPYFAMEFVSGEAITEYCDRARLDLRRRVELFLQVCAAVEHAHQKGVIHRDLKPENILVNEADDGPIPKLIDFGVAKAPDRRLAAETFYTQHGIIVGSYEYMSPEQADPARFDVDTRADIYSLGAILYELLTGGPPLRSTGEVLDALEIVRRLREEEPSRPSAAVAANSGSAGRIANDRRCSVRALERTLASELDWITMRALEKERLRRYSTASALGADLQAYLAGEAVDAGPPDAGYRLRKFVRRNRALVIGLGAVLLSLALGLAVSTGLYFENRRAKELAQQQRDEILRLSDAERLKSCIEASHALVPVLPEQLPALRAWRGGLAQELVNRLPFHRATLRQLRTRPRTAENQFHFELLSNLIADLEAFAHPDPGVGTIASIEWRISQAERMEGLSARYAGEWRETIARIADESLHPLYHGLRVEAVESLVPLGVDSASGLFEFAHLCSGEIPRRGRDGALLLNDASAIVMVLVPAGRFVMGATADASVAAAAGIPPSRYARENEGPPHWEEVPAFFLSKFETTQGQWLRLAHHNPSRLQPGLELYGHRSSLLHPVDELRWSDAEWISRLADLRLPSEREWEYAARAGGNWPWGEIEDKRELAQVANLVDLFAEAHGKPPGWRYEQWDDGYADTAPVGSYRANGLGLHDMIGNLWEWCADVCQSDDGMVVARRAGNAVTGERHTARGADYTHNADGARVARRACFNPGFSEQLGVRMARSIQPAQSR